MPADPAITTGPHGGDARRVAFELGLDPADVIDLSASMNPFAPDVAEVAARHLTALGYYPDPSEAEAILAFTIGVDPDRLLLTNGGAEAIALLAEHLGEGWVEEPEFSLYRRHLPVVRHGAARWRSNPSNPLGTLAAAEEQAAVWDEAFYPIATGEWTRGDDSAWRLGSLTKLWACPGLRLGYVIAPTAEDARLLRERQPRWAVNGLALGIVPELLASTELERWRRGLTMLIERFATDLDSMGFETVATEANWVLVAEPSLRSKLAPRGIVVRDCASFAMRGVSRVAIPRPEQFDRVLAAFAGVAAAR
jgi:histidinol-phosphate/aromatic aminotransferase/cobyric acid decarboxylase-like protein